MKKKALNLIAVILTLGIIFELYIYFNSPKDSNVLENIQIADSLKDSKQIAIKVQNDDFSWDDKGINYEKWPSTDTHEYYGSECVGEDGISITPTTDIINFDVNQNKATITTDRTVYCTLMFARRSTVLNLMKQTTTSDYLKTYDGKTAEKLEQGEETEDELLRYIGTKTDVSSNKLNNFICFGTENKDKCLADKNTYMYRIIGITTNKVNTSLGLEENQIKIIKATPLKTSQKWSADYNYDWDHGNNDVRKYLNTETADFLKTIKDIEAKVGTHNWIDLITSEKWYKGDNRSAISSKTEVKILTTGNYKVGLMYASDYYNSWTYATNTNSWLLSTNGMSGSTSAVEWTMTRYGLYSSGNYRVWNVAGMDGTLNSGVVSDGRAIRPVFYLTRDISILGAGTESNPFIISDRIVS